MEKLLLFLTVALLLQGCAAPFSEYYHDQTGGADIMNNPSVIITQEEPKLFYGNNENEDSLKMLEDNYNSLGYSLFNSGDADEKGAIRQAKKLHAAVVLLYINYTNTVSGSMPLTLPNIQTSNTAMSGSISGSGGYQSYSGNAYTTTYGTTTTYVPYNVRRSNYLATYWVKRSDPTFGTFLSELTDEERQKISSNKGMRVVAVVKNSPAFFADIFRGDILRQIGEIEIYDQQRFIEALRMYKEKTVEVTVNQNGFNIIKLVTLNSRSF